MNYNKHLRRQAISLALIALAMLMPIKAWAQTDSATVAKLQAAYEMSMEQIMTLREENKALKENQKLYTDTIARLKKKVETLQDRPLAQDKQLINIASNFLFIPYEQYSIDSIAIPSFEYVGDQELYRKYEDRLDKLKNYKEDVEELYKFLTVKSKGKTSSIQLGYLKQEFDKLKCKARYEGFFSDAYLKQIIDSIDRKLKSNGNVDFGPEIKKLQRCRE